MSRRADGQSGAVCVGQSADLARGALDGRVCRRPPPERPPRRSARPAGTSPNAPPPSAVVVDPPESTRARRKQATKVTATGATTTTTLTPVPEDHPAHRLLPPASSTGQCPLKLPHSGAPGRRATSPTTALLRRRRLRRDGYPPAARAERRVHDYRRHRHTSMITRMAGAWMWYGCRPRRIPQSPARPPFRPSGRAGLSQSRTPSYVWLTTTDNTSRCIARGSPVTTRWGTAASRPLDN